MIESKKIQRTIYVEDELWNRVMEKAGRHDIDRSVSQLARRLLEMWVNDEIEPYKEKVK